MGLHKLQDIGRRQGEDPTARGEGSLLESIGFLQGRDIATSKGHRGIPGAEEEAEDGDPGGAI